MAVVILGGLVTSTALNLFLMPSLYSSSGAVEPFRPWRPNRDWEPAVMNDGRRRGWHRRQV